MISLLNENVQHVGSERLQPVHLVAAIAERSLLCFVGFLNWKQMTRQFSISQIFLWLFVIALGIEIGAGLYETLVVLPLWTSAPPASVTAYHQHNAANPQFTLNAGGRF
jgi:hypothetical protein